MRDILRELRNFRKTCFKFVTHASQWMCSSGPQCSNSNFRVCWIDSSNCLLYFKGVFFTIKFVCPELLKMCVRATGCAPQKHIKKSFWVDSCLTPFAAAMSPIDADIAMATVPFVLDIPWIMQICHISGGARLRPTHLELCPTNRPTAGSNCVVTSETHSRWMWRRTYMYIWTCVCAGNLLREVPEWNKLAF